MGHAYTLGAVGQRLCKNMLKIKVDDITIACSSDDQTRIYNIGSCFLIIEVN